jgi:hypothetical protein
MSPPPGWWSLLGYRIAIALALVMLVGLIFR